MAYLRTGRCCDCDVSLTAHDFEALEAVNADYRHYSGHNRYNLSDDGQDELPCADWRRCSPPHLWRRNEPF
jgi:hypothetical protein